MKASKSTTPNKNITMMKAIAINEASDDFNVVEILLPVPSLKDGHHLIKVNAVGLNPVDGKLAECGFSRWSYPHVIGLDAVGTVVENSNGAAPAVGTRVAWHHNVKVQGVLSEYVIVPSHALIEVPESVPTQVAATVPSSGITAYMALERLGLHEEQTVLIKGGAGSVGQFAIQLAHNIGYRVITTARAENAPFLRQLGADHVIDYINKDIQGSVLEITCQRGVDAIIDTIGGETTSQDLGALKFTGSIACLTPFDPIEKEPLFTKAPTLIAISLNGAWLSEDMCAQLKLAFIGKKLFECVAKGKLKTPEIIDVKFDASAIEYALKQQLQRKVKGKQVVMLCS